MAAIDPAPGCIRPSCVNHKPVAVVYCCSECYRTHKEQSFQEFSGPCEYRDGERCNACSVGPLSICEEETCPLYPR